MGTDSQNMEHEFMDHGMQVHRPWILVYGAWHSPVTGNWIFATSSQLMERVTCSLSMVHMLSQHGAYVLLTWHTRSITLGTGFTFTFII